MPRPENKRINRDQYDAVLFDLDGVVTDTASIHATCWKQMFDQYLRNRARNRGEAFRPFELATDYRLYVDGKPRFDGVRDFLSSRAIHLPEGNPEDPTDVETVCGLGNRKNDLVNLVIADVGVDPYDGTVRFIHQLRRNLKHVCPRRLHKRFRPRNLGMNRWTISQSGLAQRGRLSLRQLHERIDRCPSDAQRHHG